MNELDIELALTLIKLNEAAYVLCQTGTCDLPVGFSSAIPIRMDPKRLPAVLRGDDRPIWGLITWRDGRQYIVFRGTETLREWIADAYALPMCRWGNGISVHHGFSDIFEPIWQAIAHNVDGGAVFTGHSLGSPLAAQAYVRSGARGTLIRFASPRVGNAGFAAKLEGTWRIVNEPDLIPHLPNIIGFMDAGNLCTVNGPGKLDEELAHALTSYAIGLERTQNEQHKTQNA